MSGTSLTSPQGFSLNENHFEVKDLSQDSLDKIIEIYSTPRTSFIRSNMVVSLDGNYFGPSGKSKDISSSFDILIMQVIRMHSDAVLVGAKTALGPGYHLDKLRPQQNQDLTNKARLVVVSNTLSIPDDAPLFANKIRPLVITKSSNDIEWKRRFDSLSERLEIHAVKTRDITGKQIREVLTHYQLQKVVCEGGPKLLDTMLHDDQIDEMCLTISPTLLGTFEHTNESAFTSALGSTAKHFEFSHVHSHDGFIFARLAPTNKPL